MWSPMPWLWRTLLVVASTWAVAGALIAQTTDGFVGGLVRDSVTGDSVEGAAIVCENAATNTSVTGHSGSNGAFGLPLLPPGTYRIRVEEKDHQGVDIENLDLAVAGSIDLDLRMRPLSQVWERGQYRSVFLPGTRTLAVFYGPDVDTSYSSSFQPPDTSAGRLDTSISDVIPPQLIAELPLQGRDVYTALVIEPGVASDTSTARGIGVAVNGQRPASSNFLLDGAENNNFLLSGPLLTVAPESVAEFRFSTAGFSAEYGRTSGFVVNAVTRAGSSVWHGIGYLDSDRAGFNANDFQRNAGTLGRLPFDQNNFGVYAGGPAPLRRHSVFLATGLDFLRSEGSQDALSLRFPSASYVAQAAASDPGSFGVHLLERYAPPVAVPSSNGIYGTASMSPTTTLHRFLGLERMDVEPEGATSHFSLRLAGGWISRPDFFWSPYPGFSTPLDERTGGAAASLRSAPTANLTNEARLAWTLDNLALPRPHSEIPNLVADDNVQLPQAGILYAYRNRSQTVEFADNLTFVDGRHIFKFGGDLLWRAIGGYLAPEQDGALAFASLDAFLHDLPLTLELPIDRLAFRNNTYRLNGPNRDYRNHQFALFAEDSVRLTRRLSMNFGVRYDNFGAPVNVGAAKDDLVQFANASNMQDRIAGTTVVPGSGSEMLYRAGNNNWAGRFGFSYALDRSGETVLRGGYGLFYDRSFDNLWENLALNNVLLTPGFFLGAPISYAQPLIQTLAKITPGGGNFNQLTMYQPGIRTPYSHAFFLGIQRQIARGVVLETNYAASMGRDLITTDRINRFASLPQTSDNPAGQFNPGLPEIRYIGNQGDSNYDALTVKLSGSVRNATFRLAYTWSHAIDNQSEPLLGEYDDLSLTNASASGSRTGVAAFTQQFASSLDRGNSDFDQRQNLVGMGFWTLPGVLKGWRVSWLGAIRSGLPYTVYASLGSPLYNARANLIDPSAWRVDQPAGGGKRLLNPAAFAIPAAGTIGNTGRNAFPGPGFFSADASVARSFHFKRLPEADRLIFRVDVFNLLNHANLNDPVVALGPSGHNQNFGIAAYGRIPNTYGSPVLTPFQETARQVHLLLRFEF
jgi:hypothetical protein